MCIRLHNTEKVRKKAAWALKEQQTRRQNHPPALKERVLSSPRHGYSYQPAVEVV